MTGSAGQNAAPQGDKQPQPSLKVTTRIVLVDVVATNGKNEPVTDLAASDFTVFENGKPSR